MNNIFDINSIIIELLRSCGSQDMAEAEFHRMMLDDPELRAAYRAWCDDNGYTERRGFAEYSEEYLASQESVWDALTDFDDHD